MSEKSLLELALEYASWGWRVFPLLPKDKRPFPGSHGFEDATTDPAQIKSWWAKNPQANIGLATGPGSGVVVVDLDINSEKSKDGAAEWQAMVAGKPDKIVPCAKTGGGGYHLFFKSDDPAIRNRVISKSIDLRGEGGYVVLPGSIHPNGSKYEWIEHPETCAPAPFPDWLKAGGNLVGLVDTAASAKPQAGIDAYERCRRYVATLPPAISGCGGHSATLRVAGECYRFGLTDSQAWDILSHYNATQCQPPWSEKDLRRKWREGKKLVDREGKFGKRLEEGDSYADWPISETKLATDEHRLTRIEEIADPEPPAPAKIDKFPANLLEPCGAVGSLVKWINATAYKPQPVLALANSLAFWGAILGQRVRTPSDLRTNLFCLGVGESGCGKDHSRKQIKRICDAAGITGEVLGGEELASDSAIMASVYRSASGAGLNGILFQLDEIGQTLSIINSKYAAAHMQSIPITLMKLFSSANTTVIGKEFAQRERQDIREPCVCLYGTTVPDRLFGGLSKYDISNGFLGRMLVFISDDPDPAEGEKPMLDFPDDVLDTIKFWREVERERQHAGNLAGRAAKAIAFDKEAQEAIDNFVAYCAKEKAAARDGSGMDVLWSRAPEHARKVALTVAGSFPTKEFCVSGEISRWSVALVAHLTGSLIAAISENMADSDFERQIQRVLRAIGRSSITRTQLSRKTRGMLPRTRAEVIRELIETDQIELFEKQSSDLSKRPTQHIRRIDKTTINVRASNGRFILNQPSDN